MWQISLKQLMSNYSCQSVCDWIFFSISLFHFFKLFLTSLIDSLLHFKWFSGNFSTRHPKNSKSFCFPKVPFFLLISSLYHLCILFLKFLHLTLYLHYGIHLAFRHFHHWTTIFFIVTNLGDLTETDSLLLEFFEYSTFVPILHPSQ